MTAIRRGRLTAAASMLLLACGRAAPEAGSPPPVGSSQPPGGPPQPPQPPVDPQPAPGARPAPVDAIVVWFKLDPRLSGGTYGGDVWISPPTYMGIRAQDTVEARARGVDAAGSPAAIRPDWIPSDRDMVTVSPARGDHVTIQIHRVGESTVTIVAPGVSKQLIIRATSQGGPVEQVTISQ